jgi:hemoglobin
MAGTFEKTALANDSARGTHLPEAPPHKQLPVAKEHFDRWMEIFTLRQQTSYLLEPLRKKLNVRIWQMFNYKINYFRNAGQNGDLLNLK